MSDPVYRRWQCTEKFCHPSTTVRSMFCSETRGTHAFTQTFAKPEILTTVLCACGPFQQEQRHSCVEKKTHCWNVTPLAQRKHTPARGRLNRVRIERRIRAHL